MLENRDGKLEGGGFMEMERWREGDWKEMFGVSFVCLCVLFCFIYFSYPVVFRWREHQRGM